MIERSLSGKTLIFIPTFNDVELLSTIIKDVLALGDNYVPLIIDDGSSPRLHVEALPKGCLLFSLPNNMGLGMCTHIALSGSDMTCIYRLIYWIYLSEGPRINLKIGCGPQATASRAGCAGRARSEPAASLRREWDTCTGCDNLRRTK